MSFWIGFSLGGSLALVIALMLWPLPVEVSGAEDLADFDDIDCRR